jgi:two-component system cell cycle sensor histidine kinase PleC
MLLNLLSNAIKFTPQGGHITLTGAIAGDNGIRFVVGDNGIGIDKDDIETVLSPFGQSDSPLAREHQGTGLGLPLVKAMVEMHGGRMELDSAPGVGTIATLCFPPSRLAG